MISKFFRGILKIISVIFIVMGFFLFWFGSVPIGIILFIVGIIICPKKNLF